MLQMGLHLCAAITNHQHKLGAITFHLLASSSSMPLTHKTKVIALHVSSNRPFGSAKSCRQLIPHTRVKVRYDLIVCKSLFPFIICNFIPIPTPATKSDSHPITPLLNKQNVSYTMFVVFKNEAPSFSNSQLFATKNNSHMNGT
jgi:hypothetical protein